MGPMGAYQLFAVGGEAVGGMMTKTDGEPAPFWLYYFVVDEIDAAAARVTDRGGEVLRGPHPVPGGGWIFTAGIRRGAVRPGRPAKKRLTTKVRTGESRMIDELVFYTNPMSRGRIVRWMLEEVGPPYRQSSWTIGRPMKSPDYLAINPMGKVPAIRHGDAVVTEAAAICAYLADAFPEAGPGAAARRPARGPYYRWLFFGAGPSRRRRPTRRSASWCRAEREPMVGLRPSRTCSTRSSRRVSRADYSPGDRFTAADVYVGSQIGWGMMFGTIEKRPAFERYYERSGRPAAQRAREIDEALMSAQPQSPAAA